MSRDARARSLRIIRGGKHLLPQTPLQLYFISIKHTEHYLVIGTDFFLAAFSGWCTKEGYNGWKILKPNLIATVMPVRTQKHALGGAKTPSGGIQDRRGSSPSKGPIVSTPPPPPPTSLTLTEVSGCSITARWIAPPVPPVGQEVDSKEDKSDTHKKERESDSKKNSPDTDAGKASIIDSKSSPVAAQIEPVVEYDVRFDGRDRNGGKVGTAEVVRTSKAEFQATVQHTGN